MAPRSIIAITGDDRVPFLQGILTQDVTKLAEAKIQFAALLSPQGKIVNDMFLIEDGDRILIDTAAQFKDTLLKRLAMYKLRAKVTVEDISDRHFMRVCEMGLPDPRHPSLPQRLYTTMQPPADSIDPSSFTFELGIPELGHDFAPDELVPLDAGYDLLHAISFTKGCYVGQEVTARMHYKHIARRGFYLLTNDTLPPRLALLKFEEVEAGNGSVTVDNQPWRATLPAWMEPKFAQFQSTREKQ